MKATILCHEKPRTGASQTSSQSQRHQSKSTDAFSTNLRGRETRSQSDTRDAGPVRRHGDNARSNRSLLPRPEALCTDEQGVRSPIESLDPAIISAIAEEVEREPILTGLSRPVKSFVCKEYGDYARIRLLYELLETVDETILFDYPMYSILTGHKLERKLLHHYYSRRMMPMSWFVWDDQSENRTNMKIEDFLDKGSIASTLTSLVPFRLYIVQKWIPAWHEKTTRPKYSYKATLTVSVPRVLAVGKLRSTILYRRRFRTDSHRRRKGMRPRLRHDVSADISDSLSVYHNPGLSLADFAERNTESQGYVFHNTGIFPQMPPIDLSTVNAFVDGNHLICSFQASFACYDLYSAADYDDEHSFCVKAYTVTGFRGKDRRARVEHLKRNIRKPDCVAVIEGLGQKWLFFRAEKVKEEGRIVHQPKERTFPTLGRSTLDEEYPPLGSPNTSRRILVSPSARSYADCLKESKMPKAVSERTKERRRLRQRRKRKERWYQRQEPQDQGHSHQDLIAGLRNVYRGSMVVEERVEECKVKSQEDEPTTFDRFMDWLVGKKGSDLRDQLMLDVAMEIGIENALKLMDWRRRYDRVFEAQLEAVRDHYLTLLDVCYEQLKLLDEHDEQVKQLEELTVTAQEEFSAIQASIQR